MVYKVKCLNISPGVLPAHRAEYHLRKRLWHNNLWPLKWSSVLQWLWSLCILWTAIVAVIRRKRLTLESPEVMLYKVKNFGSRRFTSSPKGKITTQRVNGDYTLKRICLEFAFLYNLH